MLKPVVIVSCLVGLIQSVQGQVVQTGQCPTNIAAVSPFDAQAYTGTWYLIETFPSAFQGGTCIDATYTLTPGGTVNVLNTQVLNGALDTMTGTATVATPGTGHLSVVFPTAPNPSNYYVLGTDYQSWALVYSCLNQPNNVRHVWAWKMSRTRSLTATANTAINNLISSATISPVISDTNFQPINHSPAGCFYFPPATTTPIRFRSRCDTSINAVPNFNPQAFGGQWNLIETYPSQFQGGTCISAVYSLLDGGFVQAVNTQVIGQQLDTRIGMATLASTDESGILSVTFPGIGGALPLTTSYMVLATDYENYALVYTCVNEPDNNEYSNVWSWKMSRTRSLDPLSNVQINSAISTIPVLDARYYQPVDHSPQACFYFPEPRPGVPVIFPGQCDNTINAVSTFNLQQFNGTWYEIEAYPKEQQRGQCISHEFSGDSTTQLSLVSSSVIGDSIVQTNGTLTTTNTNGRLVITISDGNSAIQIPYWILATDYSNYTLAYSCVNVGTERRAVYSWKLSRTNTLSAQHRLLIDNAMLTINVVDNRYFETIDLSASACFHYPEFDELPGVIELDGSCPPVSGMPNFNAGAYLGRWFEVERYPDPNQEGQCSRAEYSLDPLAPNVVVNVYNTQVVNRNLLIQTGTAVPVGVGVGELLVTFNVNGVVMNANYYILGTDYTSYALVYSCRNVAGGRRQVFSWKLSRSTTLSPQAINSINALVNSTPGLQNAYYTPTNQTQEACFYIPPVVPNQPVLLRGTCNGITGSANFNLTHYLGWWHETSRYPTATPVGNCINTRYSQIGNQVQFVETQVVNTASGATLQEARGTVQATTNGLLTKVYTTPQARTENIWVMGTDYANYALLLSCEPIAGSEYVRVWSSIQRKQSVLTANTLNTINIIIASNDFLDQSLYLPVSQTEDSCFTIPTQNEPSVVLRGQCDDNIPVQANFNLNDFLGTWYQIQRYPYPEISSAATCVGTRYTAGSGNAVNVLNWMTLADNLVTIEGTATAIPSAALLDVELTQNGTTSSQTLRVLSTDYNNYALLYTCTNINAFERQVVALKLSRERTLSAASNTAINQYMATRRELEQSLFISVEQNDECQNSAFAVTSSIILIAFSFVYTLFA